MTGWRQIWLVARREMSERSRSRAFWVSILLTVVAVSGMIILPAVVSGGGNTKHVGLTGATPVQLGQIIQSQGRAVGTNIRLDRYDTVAAGEQAVRDKHIDVLLVDARRLAWPRQADEKLKAVLTGAIQVDAIRGRAAEGGITPERLSALLAPVPVQNERIGAAPGLSPDDETVALTTAALLMLCITTFGALVLNGVVEEKASRVVEVLLSRVSARNLLAGKIAGIGLLGLAQIAVVAVAALIAASTVSSVDLPAIRGTVAAWVVIWFVLGYGLYATAFGTLGSLASRVEDAQTVTGPVTVLLISGFFASFAAIGSPASAWASAISLFPLTAPMAMPGRIAMGVTAWWEPVAAVAVTLAAIAALVHLGGRLYVRAILHSGATLSLGEAWRAGATTVEPPLTGGDRRAAWVGVRAGRLRDRGRNPQDSHPVVLSIILCSGVAIGVVVAVLAKDVIVGVVVGTLLVAVATQLAKIRTRHGSVRHP